MMPIKQARCSVILDHIHRSRTKRALLPMGALLLIFSAGSSFAQTDAPHFVDRDSSRPQTVSKNQLLAPGKAMRATELARKDIIEGHVEKAQIEIARALDIAPHFAAAEVMQGAIDLERENYDKATALFQQAIDDDPALGGAYLGMAMILIHQRRFQAALPPLDRAEGLLPGAWLVRFAKAWAQLETGNSTVALKTADYAERIAGTDPEKRSGVCYLRAMVSIHMNDMETARKFLAEAVARDPRSQYASLAKRELERLLPLLAASR